MLMMPAWLCLLMTHTVPDAGHAGACCVCWLTGPAIVVTTNRAFSTQRRSFEDLLEASKWAYGVSCVPQFIVPRSSSSRRTTSKPSCISRELNPFSSSPAGFLVLNHSKAPGGLKPTERSLRRCQRRFNTDSLLAVVTRVPGIPV